MMQLKVTENLGGIPSAAAGQRAFLLSIVQPGLAGLMDGSISSLAPLFAAAFATRDGHTAFLVGVATAIGAGISMAFSEGLSDDGKLSVWIRNRCMDTPLLAATFKVVVGGVIVFVAGILTGSS